MSSPREPDPVRPALRRAEAEAARHLEEACEEIGRKDLSQESLDELLRLEDELLAAARAVDETVRLRRQLQGRPAADSESRRPNASATARQPQADAPVCRLREFLDTTGREWRVWEVKPGASGRLTNPQQYFGEYSKGWLAFECPHAELRKRLPNHPTDWFQLTDAALDQLLPRAADVPKRRPKDTSAATL